MNGTLHITSGDITGDRLIKSGIGGEVLVWHDILYDGPRRPGWPDDTILDVRARFLGQATGGGLGRESILVTLKAQYRKLAAATDYAQCILWFDACLFDQSMLAHILSCMGERDIRHADLLCVDAFPGIERFNGLGQLSPVEIASLKGRERPVTETQFRFAEVVDRAFAARDLDGLSQLARLSDAPLPWMPAAVKRYLEEQPDPETGLGRLERLAVAAIRSGCRRPKEIFSHVAAADTAPQYWGDITLWAKINGLADREPPLVRINGPMPRLPQWEGIADLERFRVTLMPK